MRENGHKNEYSFRFGSSCVLQLYRFYSVRNTVQYTLSSSYRSGCRRNSQSGHSQRGRTGRKQRVRLLLLFRLRDLGLFGISRKTASCSCEYVSRNCDNSPCAGKNDLSGNDNSCQRRYSGICAGMCKHLRSCRSYSTRSICRFVCGACFQGNNQ